MFFIGFATAAFVSAIPLAIGEYAAGATIWPGQRGLLAMLYVAVLTSIVGHVLWIKVIDAIGPSRAGIFQNLTPIIGAVLSVLLLGETFEWHHAASLALVLSGIYVSERLVR